MSEFFKADDVQLVSNGHDYISIDTANRILSERGTRVYANHANHNPLWDEMQSTARTHSALLICVEPLKRESAEDVLRELVERYGDSGFKYECAFHKLVERGKLALERK